MSAAFANFQIRHAASRVSSLSPRQTEVLVMLSNGLTQKQMAERLGISMKTVDWHVGRMYDALGVRCPALAARAAERAGIVG